MGDIVGPLSEDYEVQKCLPLLRAMQEVRFSRGEICVMDTYISRINSKNDLDDTVIFSLSEYVNLMGLKSSHPEIVDTYTDGLLKKIIKIPISDVPLESGIDFGDECRDPKEGIFKFPLFDRCDLLKSDSGRWIIRVRCSREAKQLFFNFYKLGYIHYRLFYMLQLIHTNSCYMYMYLLTKKNMGIWTVSIEELRDRWLHVSDRKAYKEFKYFRRDVLEPSIAEINKKTDLICSYKTVTKCGRAVTGITFTVREKKAVNAPDNEQISIAYEDPRTPTEIMISSICEPTIKLKKGDITKISKALYKRFPKEEDTAARQDLLRDSMGRLMAEMQKKEKTISSLVNYLVGIIGNPQNTVRSPEGKGPFPREFERFWAVYPRKSDKSQGYTQWTRRLHEGDTVEDLLVAATAFANECFNNNTEETFIYEAKNFLKKDGKYLNYIDEGKALMAAEAQRKAEEEARETNPEYQAEQEQIRKEIQKKLKTEPEHSNSNKKKALEELMDYWREIRADDIKWTEEQDEKVYTGIKTSLQTHSSEQIKAVLDDAKKYHGNLPNFGLVGII